MAEVALPRQWTFFVAELREAKATDPFLVPEDGGWALYAQSRCLLVRPSTAKHEPRTWQTLDGLLNDLVRGLGRQPDRLVIYPTLDAAMRELGLVGLSGKP